RSERTWRLMPVCASPFDEAIDSCHERSHHPTQFGDVILVMQNEPSQFVDLPLCGCLRFAQYVHFAVMPFRGAVMAFRHFVMPFRHPINDPQRLSLDLRKMPNFLCQLLDCHFVFSRPFTAPYGIFCLTSLCLYQYGLL